MPTVPSAGLRRFVVSSRQSPLPSPTGVKTTGGGGWGSSDALPGGGGQNRRTNSRSGQGTNSPQGTNKAEGMGRLVAVKPKNTRDSFRILSWNILADIYATQVISEVSCLFFSARNGDGAPHLASSEVDREA